MRFHIFLAGNGSSPAGPAGMQRFFEESFYLVTDRSDSPPPITEELMGRMMGAAARNGLEFLRPARIN